MTHEIVNERSWRVSDGRVGETYSGDLNCSCGAVLAVSGQASFDAVDDALATLTFEHAS